MYDGVFEVLQWLLFLSAVPPAPLLKAWCVTAKALPDISAISALTAVKHGNCSSLTPLLNPVRTRKSKWAYSAKKMDKVPSTLHLIIDEAHNILSNTSFRESESWKDYRLETFEEIIKEGRKFGVFVTISSQRPNDISPTIISQAHNYFIHRLINQNDLYAIEKSVSYIDRMTEESIPTLATGTCIFSGVICPMPLKLRINELSFRKKPHSHTLNFEDLML